MFKCFKLIHTMHQLGINHYKAIIKLSNILQAFHSCVLDHVHKSAYKQTAILIFIARTCRLLYDYIILGRYNCVCKLPWWIVFKFDLDPKSVELFMNCHYHTSTKHVSPSYPLWTGNAIMMPTLLITD